MEARERRIRAVGAGARMRWLAGVVIGTSAALVWSPGCSRESAPSAAPASRAVDATIAATAQPPCPIGEEEATLAMSDAPDGADLTLRAPTERVPDLRRRARDVAAMYGAGAHKGLGYHGVHLGAHRHGLRLADLPPLEASVEDVDGGARIHIRAKRAPDVDALRSSLRARVEAVQAGPCD